MLFAVKSVVNCFIRLNGCWNTNSRIPSKPLTFLSGILTNSATSFDSCSSSAVAKGPLARSGGSVESEAESRDAQTIR